MDFNPDETCWVGEYSEQKCERESEIFREFDSLKMIGDRWRRSKQEPTTIWTCLDLKVSMAWNKPYCGRKHSCLLGPSSQCPWAGQSESLATWHLSEFVHYIHDWKHIYFLYSPFQSHTHFHTNLAVQLLTIVVYKQTIRVELRDNWDMISPTTR